MKKKLLIGLIIYIIFFFLFFLFRLIYGYTAYPDNKDENIQEIIQSNLTYNNVKKNIATVKYKEQSIVVDQKYEKIAKIISASQTKLFESDVKKVRDTIKNYNALIQLEKRSGLTGKRFLHLIIGVPPVYFDKMINEIKAFGKLVSINIEKIDKTNEFKELTTKQNSLIKTRDSLIKLKNRNAKVDELIKLENRILEIENDIQSYGVSLGEFDKENEFCTIKFTLNEISNKKEIPLLHRIKISLEWTIGNYLKLTLTLFIGFLLILIIIIILNKLKIFTKVIKKFLDS